MRTIEKHGGLDAFLLKASESDLSPKARILRTEIKRRLAEAA